MSTALGKVCNACGLERKKKGIKYDPISFMPYCENPYICNEDHPNSPKNLIARGSELKMIPFEEAQVKFGEWVALNHPNPETSDKIRRMVTQPTTIRIGSPELAQFILDFQKEYEFETVSDTIRYCIQRVREDRHLDPKPAPEPEKAPEKAPEPEPEKKPEPEPEEEFVF